MYIYTCICCTCICIYIYNVLAEAANFLLNSNCPLLSYKELPILLEVALYPAKNFIFLHNFLYHHIQPSGTDRDGPWYVNNYHLVGFLKWSLSEELNQVSGFYNFTNLLSFCHSDSLVWMKIWCLVLQYPCCGGYTGKHKEQSHILKRAKLIDRRIMGHW